MTSPPAFKAADRASDAPRNEIARDVTARIEPNAGIMALWRAMLTPALTEGGRADRSALLDG